VGRFVEGERRDVFAFGMAAFAVAITAICTAQMM
jgi:hypothetical protein